MVEGGGLKYPLKASLPIICTAGSSEAAREFGAKHADYYLMRAENQQKLPHLLQTYVVVQKNMVVKI